MRGLLFTVIIGARRHFVKGPKAAGASAPTVKTITLPRGLEVYTMPVCPGLGPAARAGNDREAANKKSQKGVTAPLIFKDTVCYNLRES